MKKYQCSECGSEDLVWRGYISWRVETQQFEVELEVEQADNEAFCDACQSEGDPNCHFLEEGDES